MSLIWKKETGRFSSGESGFRGKIELFSYFYDASRSKSIAEMPPWKLKCNIPGIKADLGNFQDGESCKQKAEAVFEHWLKMMNLKPDSLNTEQQ